MIKSSFQCAVEGTLEDGINGARPRLFPRLRSPSPSERNHARSAFLTVFHHTATAKQGTRQSRERMENGVKNLKEARLFPKTLSNHGIGEDDHSFFHL